MTGMVEPGDGGAAVKITNRIYLDGLNHQTFSTGLRELVGAVDALGITAAAAAGETEQAAAPEPAPAPAPAPEPAPATEPTPEPAARQTPSPPEATREMAPSWTATHAVPSGGMSAWSEPNPELQPVTTLDARVQLSVAERRGDWAKVVGSNGWTGWVDARRLTTLGAKPSTSSGLGFGAGKPSPIILAGALLIGIAALLPWLDNGFETFNAMDLSASILFDYEGTGSPYIGWVLFALGALAIAAGFMAKPTAPTIVVGIAAVAVPVLFAAQIYRLVSDLGGSFSDLTDVLGFGPAVALVGGIVAIVGGNR